MAIYSGFIHEKWWFSIVFCMFTRGYVSMTRGYFMTSWLNNLILVLKPWKSWGVLGGRAGIQRMHCRNLHRTNLQKGIWNGSTGANACVAGKPKGTLFETVISHDFPLLLIDSTRSMGLHYFQNTPKPHQLVFLVGETKCSCWKSVNFTFMPTIQVILQMTRAVWFKKFNSSLLKITKVRCIIPHHRARWGHLQVRYARYAISPRHRRLLGRLSWTPSREWVWSAHWWADGVFSDMTWPFSKRIFLGLFWGIGYLSWILTLWIHLDSWILMVFWGFLHVLAIFGTGSPSQGWLGWLPMVHRRSRNRRTSCRRAPRAFRCATSGIRTIPIRGSVCETRVRYDRTLETQRWWSMTSGNKIMKLPTHVTSCIFFFGIYGIHMNK